MSKQLTPHTSHDSQVLSRWRTARRPLPKHSDGGQGSRFNQGLDPCPPQARRPELTPYRIRGQDDILGV